jgi:hypothetical protein
MSRSLRIASLPPTQPVVRFSGYLTDPTITDAQVLRALTPFFLNPTLWRAPTQLPNDWLTLDDSAQQNPVPGVTLVWGQGTDVSAAPSIGDPETPWRLLVGGGQLAITDVWLYDPQASPWPASACAACQTGVSLGHTRRGIDAVVDSFAIRPPTRPTRTGSIVAGVAAGGAVGAAFLGAPGAVAGALLGGVASAMDRR